MEQYVRDRYVSRGIDIWEEPLPCEKCFYSLLNWDIKSWVKIWVDHHHICPWERMRKHKKDWSDVILLCRQHHSIIHSDNGYESIQLLLAIVKETIIVYKRMGHKEKLWALVEHLYSKFKYGKSKWLRSKKDWDVSRDEETVWSWQEDNVTIWNKDAEVD